jgi:hypothetical protein
MRRICGVAAVVLSLGLAASAGAENDRYKGCVTESPRASECAKEVTGPGVVTLRFTDRKADDTRYGVCVKDIVGKQCFHGKTGKRGLPDAVFFQPRASGEHTVRWKVDGHQIERWDFNLIPAPQ